MKAIFLDRDGTVNVGYPTYDRVDSIDKVELFPHTLEALSELAKLDYAVFLVTNQSGIAEGLITMEDFNTINNRILELIEPSGIRIVKTYVCPHGPNDNCACRKPKPKLLQDAIQEFDIDVEQSWMVGDRETDVLTGKNAGTQTILVETGGKPAGQSAADFVAKDLLAAVRHIAESQKA